MALSSTLVPCYRIALESHLLGLKTLSGRLTLSETVEGRSARGRLLRKALPGWSDYEVTLEASTEDVRTMCVMLVGGTSGTRLQLTFDVE